MAMHVNKSLRRAQKYLKLGEFQKAQLEFIQILEKFPKNINALKGFHSIQTGLGGKIVAITEPPEKKIQGLNVLLNKGDSERVLDELEGLIILFPESIVLLSIQGAAYAHEKKYDSALVCCKKIIAIQPNHAEALFNSGFLHSKLGNFTSALESYKDVIKINPKYTNAHLNSAEILINENNYCEAIKCYARVIEYQPSDVMTHNEMALAYKNMGQIDKALECFRQILLIDHDLWWAKFNIAELYYENNDFDQAKKHFDTVDNQTSVAKGLECLFRLGDFELFNSRLETIKKTDSANLRVAAISAFSAQQLGQEDIYPFCKNPLKFLRVSHLDNHLGHSELFLKELLEELNSRKTQWSPSGRTTRNGYRTKNDLFNHPSPKLQKLEKIIHKELKCFHEDFSSVDINMITHWPQETNVSGWYVRLVKNGHQVSHIHPNGWVSGVIYLKTIENPNETEGAIEFGLHGFNYPVLKHDHPKKLHQPNNGDIVLFPSSLFHQTVPVIQDAERCVIAFDLVGQTLTMN